MDYRRTHVCDTIPTETFTFEEPFIIHKALGRYIVSKMNIAPFLQSKLRSKQEK